ncbi:MAG: type IV pilin-like G/H family protein [Cyanobacteria bacterium]|nr:type IV pilin-like G/H family protein [Cyanobacteriota bacterium]
MIYEAVVYGRQQGNLFASWSQRYILQERPSDWVPDVSESVSETQKFYPVAVQLENGKTLKLDLIQLMGFGGIICLVIGLFSPIVSIGVFSVTFFQQGSYEGILLLILAVASAIFLAKQNFIWLWATATNAGLLVVLSFLGRLYGIQEAKSKLETEMAGNPFRGLADLAMQSVQLQWGWVFLIGGAVLLQAALLMRSKRPPREAYIATLVILGLVIASVLATPTMQSVVSGDTATRAKQSEAKTYVGSLIRAQQAYFMEHIKFSDSMTDLGLGITPETGNYSYSIETQGSVAVAKGSARRDGLKSYTGTVFVLKPEGSNEFTTQAIRCESNDKTKTAPDAAELIDNKPKCAKNSEAIK